MIHHHPSPDVLADYARGGLHAGAMLVVACHVQGCLLCRREAAVWESVGGALLEATTPIELSNDALARTLARLDEAPARPVQSGHRDLPAFLRGFEIPAPLRGENIGHRLWLTPNIWFAPIAIADDDKACTYLIWARRGIRFPMHTHIGNEFTGVLHGSFTDGSGTYGLGDFAATDEAITHAPTATDESECLCLSSADGPMHLMGRTARAIQTLTGRRY